MWLFTSHPPRILKVSNTAAYDWSSSTDLHLWFTCQESSPILKCTVVIRLSDSLVWCQDRAVAWMRHTTASPSLPPPRRQGGRGRSAGGGAWPPAELLLPIRTMCTKALKQPPLWHDDNVQFHTASWRLTVYYVCKIFLKMVFLNSLTTVQFLSFENPIKVYIAVHTNQKPNISMKTVQTYIYKYITYFEIYFLCWF